MKSNAEIVRDVLEQVVNQKKIDAWDQYFSPDYIARGAPFIGMGFSRDTSGNKHKIDAISPGSPAEGKLEIGDKLVWVEDERQRWATYEDIAQGLQRYWGSKLKLGVRRGKETLEVELTRGLMRGFDTKSAQAKSEMQEFMTNEIPDLRVDIKLTLADGDMVTCLMEYRGTHATYKREALWREIWVVRHSEGKIVESWPLPDVDAYLRQLGYQSISPSD
ncbi:MAG: ester cyclase [Candidatus Bipolaricaulota bacterium]|nr:ester cyclase [Candidatus Bipolaricaulota bacterium]